MAKRKVKKKKTGRKVGRPAKMTPEVVDKLERAFSIGCNDREACIYAGISRDVLYDYVKKHPEFGNRKEDLKLKPVILARETVAKQLGTSIDTAFKFLERKSRDDTGKRDLSPRVEHGGVDDAPLPPIVIEVLRPGDEPDKPEENTNNQGI